VTVTITEVVASIDGAQDNRQWIFFTQEIRESADGSEIITTTKVQKKPVGGVLTVELDPGPAVVVPPNGKSYNFIVPNSPSDLWSLIQASVALPPVTQAEKLQAAVDRWLELHPFTIGAVVAAATGVEATDRAAMHAARDAAGVGGTVYVPAGNYTVNGATLSVAHQKWVFAPGARLKLPNGATDGKIITVTGDYVTIDGGEWDGNRTNVTTPVYDASILIKATHCTVRNTYGHDTDGWGILAYPASTTSTVDGTVIEGNILIDTVAGGVNVDCITFTNATVASHGIRVSGNWISSAQTPSTTYSGIQVVGSTNTGANVLGATVEHNYINQSVAGTAGQPQGVFWRNVTGMRVDGNYIQGTELAITHDVSIDSTISNNTCCGAEVFGIEIGGACTRTTITGNTIDGQGVTLAGIGADNDVNNEITITGNTIGGLKKTTNGIGISSQSGGRTWVIAGNTIRTPSEAIEVYGASTTDVTIEGNTLELESGGSVGFYCGIYLDPFTTGARGWSVKNNNLIGWSNYGIRIEHGSALTASGITVRENTYTNCGAGLSLNNVTLDSSCSTDTFNTFTAPQISGSVAVNTAAGVEADILLQSGGTNRLGIRKSTDAESGGAGSYAGSKLEVVAYDNTGASPFVAARLDRSTGIFEFPYGVQITGGFGIDMGSTAVGWNGDTTVQRASSGVAKANGNVIRAGANIVSVDTTITPNKYLNVLTGTTARTFTLPAVSGNTSVELVFKNRSTQTLTVQRAGSDQLYDTAAVNSISVAAGASARVINDGTYWLVIT